MWIYVKKTYILWSNVYNLKQFMMISTYINTLPESRFTNT
jgi:hypothetical protein